MRAAVLWPGDSDTDPPRPTFVGDDTGVVWNGDEDWSDVWTPLYVVPTTMGRVQLAYLPDAPIFPLQDYTITVGKRRRWRFRAVYVPEVSTWYVHGPPELLDS